MKLDSFVYFSEIDFFVFFQYLLNESQFLFKIQQKVFILQFCLSLL